MLERDQSINFRGMLIYIYNGLARRHHHLNGKTGVISLAGRLLADIVERKQLPDKFLLTPWDDELKDIKGRPGIVPVEFFLK